MSFLDSLFSGVRVFVRELASVASEAVKVVLQEVDRSSIGRATTRLIEGVIDRQFSKAAALAGEERELAAKFRKDGRRSEADEGRLRELYAERDRLKKEVEVERQRRAAEELRNSQSNVVKATLNHDEVNSTVGILSSKRCSKCGSMMGIQQGRYDSGTERQSFYWQCTAMNGCPTEKLDPRKGALSVIRKPDPNFDMSLEERRELWNRQDVLTETAQRVRQGLEQSDNEIVCPVHVLPMRLVEKRKADGLLLSTYEYVCMGVEPSGRACRHTIPLKTFAQVSATLMRREGEGIIRH